MADAFKEQRRKEEEAARIAREQGKKLDEDDWRDVDAPPDPQREAEEAAREQEEICRAEKIEKLKAEQRAAAEKLTKWEVELGVSRYREDNCTNNEYAQAERRRTELHEK
jgi:uncharacterized membrane-anchored protein